jgi:hypothetical protein
MLIDHLEHASDQFLSFEIGQAAQVGGPKMSVFVGVAPRTPQRAFLRDFNGKRWDSASQGAAPGLQNWLDPQATPFSWFDARLRVEAALEIAYRRKTKRKAAALSCTTDQRQKR